MSRQPKAKSDEGRLCVDASATAGDRVRAKLASLLDRRGRTIGCAEMERQCSDGRKAEAAGKELRSRVGLGALLKAERRR